jgi:hypothetical protein
MFVPVLDKERRVIAEFVADKVVSVASARAEDGTENYPTTVYLLGDIIYVTYETRDQVIDRIKRAVGSWRVEIANAERRVLSR